MVELELVAAAELLGGAFDVGDPFAELAGVVDRLAAADALGFDGFGLVEEPVELLVGVVGVAGVVALVPEARGASGRSRRESASPKLRFFRPDSTSEAMTGVGVAGRVFWLRRPSRRRSAPWGRRRRGSPPARRGRRRARRRGRGGVERRARRRPWPAPWTALRNSWESPGLPGSGAAEATCAGWATAANSPDSFLGSGAAATAAQRRRAPRRPRPAAASGGAGAAGGAGGQLGGQLEVRGDLLLEADVDVVVMVGVGEIAGPGDRERRADLVRADPRIEL